MIRRLVSLPFMLGLLIAVAGAGFLLRDYPPLVALIAELGLDSSLDAQGKPAEAPIDVAANASDKPAAQQIEEKIEEEAEEKAAEEAETQADEMTDNSQSQIESPAPLDSSAEPLPGQVADRLFIFWGEFLLAGQAGAFARQLTRQSGVEVRTEKVDKKHRVALSFLDESDLDSKIRTIKSATGFDPLESATMRLYVMPQSFASQGAATTFMQQLKRRAVVDSHILQTTTGFAVGLVYLNELELARALQTIEPAPDPNE